MSAVKYLEENYKTFNAINFLDHFSLEDEATARRVFKAAVETLARRHSSQVAQWAKDIRLMDYSILASNRVKRHFIEKAKERAVLQEETRALERQALSAETETRLSSTLRRIGSEESVEHPSEQPVDSDIDDSVAIERPDKDALTEAFMNMDSRLKWTLSTGKIVEDTLYRFGSECSQEHLAHSFILDPSDPAYLENKVFTKEELDEISQTHTKPEPMLPTDFRDYINIFNRNNCDDLRAKVDEPQPWQHNYDMRTHGDYDWIRNTVYNLVREYEADNFKRSHLEGWYLLHVWRLIDSVFDTLESVDPIRGESCSLASSHRKNKKRVSDAVVSPQRKKFGRKCDIILRSTDATHGEIKEYGAGEVGKILDIHGSKFLRESNLKLPKVLRDMLNRLYSLANYDQLKLRQIETIGYVHFGLSFFLLRLDSPKGYCARLTRLPKLSDGEELDFLQIPQDVSSFSTNVLPVLVLAWKAKEIVRQVIDIIDMPERSSTSDNLHDSSWLENSINKSSAKLVLPTCTTSTEYPKNKKKKGQQRA